MQTIAKSIAVLTSGGDAPGLNAVIRALTKTAVQRYQMNVIGIEDGFEGLLGRPRWLPLNLTEVRGLLPRGGTILGTCNKGHFALPAKPGQLQPVVQEAIANLRSIGVEALVVIGGDGSQKIAMEFYRSGFPVYGIPKTIDNDLDGTDLTFGFDTAVDIATEALDRLHTTAESHDRVMLLEVMGRHAGWIATYAGIAGGADCILIPELPFSLEKIACKINDRERQGSKFTIIVVAEGAAQIGDKPVYQLPGRLGGISNKIAPIIEELTGKEVRVVVLGHLQRGGQPTTSDLLLATRLGASAVHFIAAGRFGEMVCLKDNKIESIPIEQAIARIKTVPPDCQLVRSARDLGISFAGAED